jgi:hypothetical protein
MLLAEGEKMQKQNRHPIAKVKCSLECISFFKGIIINCKTIDFS